MIRLAFNTKTLISETTANSVEGSRFTGRVGETFELMASAMNFTYQKIPSVDGNYGTEVDILNQSIVNTKASVNHKFLRKCNDDIQIHLQYIYDHLSWSQLIGEQRPYSETCRGCKSSGFRQKSRQVSQ
jgi:hypothetical protein